jgi:hypothetical protein
MVEGFSITFNEVSCNSILFLLTERQMYLTLLESFQNHQQGPKLLKTRTVYGDTTLIKYTITYLVELPNLLLLHLLLRK